MQKFIANTIDLNNGNPEQLRLEILAYFEKTWALDELLYTQLKSDDIFYHRGDPLRHILLFYLGHTAVFYINKFVLAKVIDQRINPAFESTFAIGVDEMSWDDLDERHYQWPTVSEVREYRKKVKEIVLDVIKTADIQLPVKWEDPLWLVMMGIEHERIHLETSSVLIRQLPLEEVVAGQFGKACTAYGQAPKNEMLMVPGAEVSLGKPVDHPLYGWDNEYGTHIEKVEAFKAAKYLTSNADFLIFINDGGYENATYWTEEGWNWRNFKQAAMPLFWRKMEDEYTLRLVAEEIPMPWNWPVEVNYLEAKAYCNWKSARTGKTFRLPTEAEWYQLAAHCEVPDVLERNATFANIALAQFHSPCPVDMCKQGDFYDVVGNVWQWTETPITGFAGFKVHPMYDDFSTPTFDGKHNIIKGGSWISTGNEATLHARYAFRRHFYQHSGFRMVESEQPLLLQRDVYETDAEVVVACESQWNDKASEKVFSKALAEHILSITNATIGKILDINADTGRLAYELAPFAEKITAIDFSARFVRMSVQLQEKGFIRYIAKDEGELVFYRDVMLADKGLGKGIEKILFVQDNANNLKPLYTGYDLIILPHLLEELAMPTVFLSQIHERMNAGGLLVIASTYDWDKNNIANEYRPGGFKRDGEPVSSYEGIRALLSPFFDEIAAPVNLLQTIHLSSRVNECRLNEVTVWKLR